MYLDEMEGGFVVHPPLRGSAALRARPAEYDPVPTPPLPRSPRRARPSGSPEAKPTAPSSVPFSGAEKRTYLGYAVLALLVVFAYLARMAYLTGLGYEASRLERETAALRQEVDLLTAEVDRLKSPERLREVAAGLGLEKNAGTVVRGDGTPQGVAQLGNRPPTGSPVVARVSPTQGGEPDAIRPETRP
ncbi:cell division protein FtsL [Brockia lithotrophica]|uniref:Cell division protein FtsL n=1 Tax=Brockia lithotrophica TaxID=933949 RepID=A0A660L6N3_9BACL|nr:cell division protein FtsL [Brockia lithotrophica]